MDIQSVKDAYRRYAAAYDLVFGALFAPGRRLAIQRMAVEAGDRVLEVGVGTGLSLPLYPAGGEIEGIDLSPEMIDRARACVSRHRLADVALAEMDAARLDFPDASFDHVVAMYVLSVVPDPTAVIAEMRRVCRPGGRIYILNHFRHEHRLVGAVERALAPLSRLVGFRPDFALDELVETNRLDVVAQHQVNAFGYWTLLEARPLPRSGEGDVDALPAQEPVREAVPAREPVRDSITASGKG